MPDAGEIGSATIADHGLLRKRLARTRLRTVDGPFSNF
jgi:hypothetical protein